MEPVSVSSTFISPSLPLSDSPLDYKLHESTELAVSFMSTPTMPRTMPDTKETALNSGLTNEGNSAVGEQSVSQAPGKGCVF